ncbi:AAA family ATPase [Oceanobacillus polygoni]|uniref:Chromosome segregation ATPase n=1 Tax=Oceanobacillus polygoni TaxID=1235259 RepID=A0A9X0Z0V2_9BACI|nr:AAA family ATPase [Oceanobacillus polygoni]MBP2079619.1 chromosome segregation ATPase [Oceanobacillus polygoni]
MNIKSIEINNYKSFKEEKNITYLEDSVTAVIGKNESGKSNFLEAIGSLHYYKKTKLIVK